MGGLQGACLFLGQIFCMTLRQPKVVLQADGSSVGHIIWWQNVAQVRKRGSFYTAQGRVQLLP